MNINPVKYNINPVKSFWFPGKIIINPVMSENSTGKIGNDTGKINCYTGKITFLRIDKLNYRIDTEKITENINKSPKRHLKSIELLMNFLSGF